MSETPMNLIRATLIAVVLLAACTSDDSDQEVTADETTPFLNAIRGEPYPELTGKSDGELIDMGLVACDALERVDFTSSVVRGISPELFAWAQLGPDETGNMYFDLPEVENEQNSEVGVLLDAAVPVFCPEFADELEQAREEGPGA